MEALKNSKIYLIRHGITEGNLKRWYYGSMDIPLDNKGIDDIVLNVKNNVYPSGKDYNFFSSGMKRTDQTLFLIYGKVERKTLSNLSEMHFGIFEGHSYEEIKDDENFQKWVSGKIAKIPQGEGKDDFKLRVFAGFNELMKAHHDAEYQDSIAVCHGGVISVIMMMLFGDEEKNFYKWIPNPARGYVLNLVGDKVRSYEPI